MIWRTAPLAGLIALSAALPAAGQSDGCSACKKGERSNRCRACSSTEVRKSGTPIPGTPEALRDNIREIEEKINNLWNEMIKHGMALQKMNKVCRACSDDPKSYDNCPAAKKKCAERPLGIKARRDRLERAKKQLVKLEKRLEVATASEKKAGKDAREKNIIESLWKKIQKGVDSLNELVAKLEAAVDPDTWSSALGEKLKGNE